jgi:hypothetical protein
LIVFIYLKKLEEWGAASIAEVAAIGAADRFPESGFGVGGEGEIKAAVDAGDVCDGDFAGFAESANEALGDDEMECGG